MAPDTEHLPCHGGELAGGMNWFENVKNGPDR